MAIDDKIINNSYDNVDYGTERTSQSPISIDPAAESLYEENMTEHIEDLYTKKKLYEELHELYLNSPYFEKYKKNPKKVERADFFGIYYYFKDKLMENNEYNIVQIFCAIAEFFDFNYKTLYNEVITLGDKVVLLETLQEQFGLEKEFDNSIRLF